MTMTKHGLTGVLLLALTACAAPQDPKNMGPPQGVMPAVITNQLGNTPFPCEVGAVLQQKCWGCHGSPTNYGAPMTLLRDEDVHGMTKDGTEQIFQRMAKRIHDTSSPMPMRGFPQLTPAELGTLDGWLAQGAPGGSGCAPPPAGGAAGAGAGGSAAVGNGGAVSYGGSTGMPSYAGQTGSGGVMAVVPPPLPEGGMTKPDPDDVPVEPDASECEMVKFHARSDANDTKFNVPTGEQYYCFSFHKDWGTGTQGLAFYPDIDNRQVIHHWLLYKAITPQVNGVNSACLGFHPDGELLAGWAPGATASFLPSHVGLDLGGGDYILEVHYNNTGAPAQDGSGVTVCKAKTPRPDTATVSWLGTEAIILPPMQKGLDIVSNCKPNITDTPIHIIKVWPHMHKLGRHMKADIHRADGTVDPLFNVDFDFNSQWGYDTPAVLKAGDYVTTTCTFDNDTPNVVTFGESTSSEMCYNFTYSYPARALVTFGLMSTACNN